MIEWYVPYEPGTLRAVAKRDGETVATHELQTAGEPAKLALETDRESVDGNRLDVAYVTARVTDEN